MHLQRSISHRRALTAHIQRETALENERRMEVQHHLYKAEQDNNYDSGNKEKVENLNNIYFALDLCLPAIFMPFRSGNIYNPKAYQYSHPIGKYYNELHLLLDFLFSLNTKRCCWSSISSSAFNFQTSFTLIRIGKCFSF